METFYGMIVPFAGSFAPRGWALCEGQLLAIRDHQALFSLLGNRYGGDGVSTFALPDLRGAAPMGQLNPSYSAVDTVDLPEATEAATLRALPVRYIIALQGLFPPRS